MFTGVKLSTKSFCFIIIIAHISNNNTCIVIKEKLMSIDTIRTKEFYNLLISKISKQPSSQISILPES